MANMRKVNIEFWKNKKVFITGHTGFKGSWLSLWLQTLGANVKGFSLEPPTNPSLFEVAKIAENMISQIGDIRNIDLLKESMISFNPDIIIHLAAQPLVRISYVSPLATYETNVMGTANVLESSRYCNNLKAIVSITTDKCYENREWVWGYREEDAMGGFDPYSSSKGCAELVSAAYRKSFFNSLDAASLATARAGNVIGGGDWATDRLIPDILKSIDNKQTIVIRNPNSIRPWQHVLEPLSGYLILAENLFLQGKKFAQAWNFGPNDYDCKPVSVIVDGLLGFFEHTDKWKLDENYNTHEAQFLKLDCSKAKYLLGWEPKWNLDETLKRIAEWHIKFKEGKSDMQSFTIKEINEYNKL
jgi:CDP-glucose 4,6-dehydratase